MEKTTIALHQVFWLFVCSRFIINLVFNPFFNELSSNQDIVPALFLGIPVQLVYALAFLFLWKKYPDQSLIEYSCSILGKLPGKPVGLLYIGYFTLQTAITVRVFVDFLSTRFFFHTPVEVIGLGLIIIVAYAMYMGLEVLGLCATVLVPLIFAGVLLLTAMALPQAHASNIIPAWETDFGQMTLSMLPTATRWSELAWMAMIFPLLGKQQRIYPAVFGGIFFVNFFFIIVNITVVAIFGPESVKNIKFPTLEMVQAISIGQFLDRIEALVLGLWVFGAFLKTGIFFYAAIQGLKQWFGLKEHKPFILPMGLMIMLLSTLLFSNNVQLSNFSKTIIPVDFAFTFLIPLLLLLVYLVKKPFKKRSA